MLSSTKLFPAPRPRRAALVIGFAISLTSILSALVMLWYTDARALLSSRLISSQNFTSLTTKTAEQRAEAMRNPVSWLRYLREHSQDGRPRTERLGCREYTAGAQSCSYEGFVCMNATLKRDFERPEVYFLDDTKPDFEEVPSDRHCHYRHQSADPRYFGTRHWPIWEDTFAPQSSCLDSFFRTEKSLLRRRLKGGWKNSKIKWLPSLWFVDYDFIDSNHNYHLLMDIIWILDVMLWQASVDLRPRPGLQDVFPAASGHLFDDGPRHLYLPQSEVDFIDQTHKDVNRLLYAMVLQLDLPRLYPDLTLEEIRTPPSERRDTAPMFKAYPFLNRKEQLLFHRDIRDGDEFDLVCAPRFAAGAKLTNGAHERVCRAMRQRGYELYGIEEPETVTVGQVHFPQPPKRIVIVQRHLNRGIGNIDALEKALKNSFGKYKVEIEIVLTDKVQNAEEHVRVFARAGVVITAHGSQSMGQIWMPRHRYVSFHQRFCFSLQYCSVLFRSFVAFRVFV